MMEVGACFEVLDVPRHIHVHHSASSEVCFYVVASVVFPLSSSPFVVLAVGFGSLSSRW